jgi:hypothetical protein
MTQRCDVALGLDSELGRIPLPVQPVSDVYRTHELTWSVAQALRVLCEAEVEGPRPPRAAPAWDADHARGYRRPAPPAKPVVESPQLALF